MSIDLLRPFDIGKLEIRNRFVRSATWDATADSSGAVTDNSVALYRELGRGGVGLIVTGFAFVSLSGQTVSGQYGAHTDDMIPGLRRLVQAAHEGGAKIALQIAHAGIGSDYLLEKGLAALAVSRIPRLSRPHREMTDEEIVAAITDFELAGRRAMEAGFDAVQLHGAHGYLMSQFLSPIFNQRTDRWGGSADNRRRFHLEVIQRLRRTVGAEFPLMVKFGVQDDRPRGLTLDDGLETARQMVANSIDAVEVSVGVGASMRVVKEGEMERAYFRENAAAVKCEVTVPVIAVGGIRSLQTARDIVGSSDADLIAMCRPFIREPGLIARWQQGDERPAKCISCNKCFGIAAKGEPLTCGEERRLKPAQRSPRTR